MISLPGSNKVYIAFAFQIILLIWLVHVTYRSDAPSWSFKEQASNVAHAAAGKLGGGHSRSEAIKAAGNRTLGFGEIVYISMPHRTDRQDAMLLAAEYSNISMTLIPGVKGETIHDKAKPAGTPVTVAELGSWRAHANAWKHLLESDKQTALILEDDVDWDVDIRTAAETLAGVLNQGNHALRFRDPVEGEEQTPYGLDWDVLWLAACIHESHPKLKKKFIQYDDPLAPPAEFISKSFKEHFQIRGLQYPEQGGKRIIVPAYKPICIWSYAVTRKGASKLLLQLGQKGLPAAADVAMMMAHESGRVWGYVVEPPLFFPWHVGGGSDSDIQNYGKENKSPIGGKSENLLHSVRKAYINEFEPESPGKTWDQFASKVGWDPVAPEEVPVPAE